MPSVLSKMQIQEAYRFFIRGRMCGKIGQEFKFTAKFMTVDPPYAPFHLGTISLKHKLNMTIEGILVDYFDTAKWSIPPSSKFYFTNELKKDKKKTFVWMPEPPPKSGTKSKVEKLIKFYECNKKKFGNQVLPLGVSEDAILNDIKKLMNIYEKK